LAAVAIAHMAIGYYHKKTIVAIKYDIATAKLEVDTFCPVAAFT
jgi:hypothetical protein